MIGYCSCLVKYCLSIRIVATAIGFLDQFLCSIELFGGTERNADIKLDCRELNSAHAVRALLDFQKQINPDVVFLSETHLMKAKAKKL